MKKYLALMAVGGVLVFVGGVLAPMVHAAPPSPNGIALPTSPLQDTADITDLFCGILDWIFWGLIVFAIIMFLVGGYYYVRSSGEAAEVQKANKTLLYAAIAIVVALVAQGIPWVMATFIQSNFAGTSVC